MIRLSFSTLNLVYTCPHNYLNKVMGLKQPENDNMKNGKRLHRIIQDHVSKVKPDKRLEHITDIFPVVERVDFDPKCRFEFDFNNRYSMVMYVDGLNWDLFRSLEIKTGTPWSIGRFINSPQRKIYNLGVGNLKENVMITAVADDTTWDFFKPKTFILPATDKDKKEAREWIAEGIKRIENIKKYVDEELSETNGTCVDRRCYWGDQCSFK